MTPAAFNAWLREYCTAFPAFLAWSRRLPDPAGSAVGWLSALEGSTAAELAELLDDMRSGRTPPIDPVDYGHFGLRIREALQRRRPRSGDEDERARYYLYRAGRKRGLAGVGLDTWVEKRMGGENDE